MEESQNNFQSEKSPLKNDTALFQLYKVQYITK